MVYIIQIQVYIIQICLYQIDSKLSFIRLLRLAYRLASQNGILMTFAHKVFLWSLIMEIKCTHFVPLHLCSRCCKEFIYMCFSREKPPINRENPTFPMCTFCTCSQVYLAFSNRGECVLFCGVDKCHISLSSYFKICLHQLSHSLKTLLQCFHSSS